MLNSGFSPWPSFDEEEVNAVSAVLKSNRVNYWTGEEARQFEREYAEWTGTKHAIALANGTVALDLAWKALEIGPGDEVICTPRTYFASVSSIVLAGAKPVFADVDPDSQNITPESVEPLITAKTKAILCVHLAGWPCDMAGFRALADRHKIAVVEDCAQAHGAHIDGRPVGSFGDANAWSFCQDKIITTAGEGGMLTTDSTELWNKAWSFKDHGKSWSAIYERDHPPGFRWVHEGWGTNWRLTEMQSAVGRIQLRRMPEWHAKRKRSAIRLTEGLGGLNSVRIPQIPSNVEHAWYKFYVFLEPDALSASWDRDRIQDAINESGVPCFAGSCPEVYLEKAFAETGFAPDKRLTNAKKLGETSLMFLVHPTLTDDEIQKTIDVAGNVLQKSVR
jgi:dTDP-4-amino-4,6-dideoxygalactose transaminase